MLKAGTVEEYLPAGHQAHRASRSTAIDLAEVDLKTLRVADKAANERIRATIDAADARAGPGRGEGRGPDRQDPPAG